MINFLRCDRLFVVAFIVLFAVGMVTHVLTLSYSPMPWFDEVEIAEMVRDGIVHQPLDHGLHYYCNNADLNTQSWALFYVGGWIQNFFYDCLGSVGPRISSLISLVLLTLLGFSYSLKKTRSLKFASVFGIILFAYPLFVQSARGARVDIWSVALLFLALLLLEIYNNKDDIYHRTVLPILVGAIATLSVFTWITSIFFGPIYLWALLAFAERDGKWMKSLLWASVGAIGTLIVLLLPFIGTQESLSHFQYVLMHVSGADRQAPDRLAEIKVFVGHLMGFPYVCLLGTVLLLLSRRTFWIKIGAFLFFIVVAVVCAQVYVYRIVFFAPFCLLGLSCYYAQGTKRRKCVLIICTGIALLCFGRGVVIRNGIEWLTRNGRSAERVQRTLETKIGRSASVYCNTFQLYYIGRNLDWRQYRFVEGVDVPSFEKCGIEWFISEEQMLSKEMVADLESAGYRQVDTLTFDRSVDNPTVLKLLQRTGRTLTYGPYVLYHKPSADSRAM